MKLLFASGNEHKIREISELIPEGYELIGLKEIGFEDDIPETADTLAGNAIQKATHLAHELDIACFADDTGLVIPELNGEPGVFSARYAGPQRNAEDNMNLVLSKLGESENRKASFITVIALFMEGEVFTFEGKVDGKIIREKKGTQGFGYDPIFVPDGYQQTFAEMTAADKNKLSHRGRALEKMVTFLKNRNFES